MAYSSGDGRQSGRDSAGHTVAQALAAGKQLSSNTQLANAQSAWNSIAFPGMSPAEITNYFRNASPQQVGALEESQSSYDSNSLYPESTWDKVGGDIALAGSMAAIGFAAAPLAAGAGAAAGGGTTGAVASGATTGAVTGAAGATLTGQNIGKGALMGAAFGGLGGGVNSALTGDGLSSGANSALARTGIGAVRGAVSGQGAAAGAEGGALNSATGAVEGSIVNGAGTIFQGNPSADPLTSSLDTANYNNQLDAYNQANPPNMSYNFQDDPENLFGNVSGSDGSSLDSGVTPADIAALTGGATTGDNSLSGLAGNDVNGMSNPGYSPLTSNFGGQVGGITPNINLGQLSGGGGGNSSLLGQLASLLGGSGGSNSSLLASLLGLGASGAGAALNSSAAKGAASTFAGQTAYNPYSISTNNGTTAFNGKTATSTLSPQQQALSSSLNGLSNSAAGSLAAGPGAAQSQIYNQLQASQAGANNKFYQNNLDNQFANGVMSSTAGQYQSQAALGAIGQQQTQDHLTANTMANTQQQQQLNNLTAGLNGNNQINAGQLSQIQTGGQMGSSASYANSGAYSPSLAANSNTPVGQLLGSLGNGVTNSGQSNNNALAQYLATYG